MSGRSCNRSGYYVRAYACYSREKCCVEDFEASQLTYVCKSRYYKFCDSAPSTFEKLEA